MLIETESNVVASAGLQQTSNFQIATTAHAFRILSSGLYSDKIGAVLREIGCNAMDAHIAAGKPDAPFEVHLPSRLTSKFYIRDFGPGLSPDEIKSLYTTYFSSSKQRSNEFTGAFGLGSKSPFSYTDNFTIVSVKDGVKTTYSAYVDQVGGPSVSMIADEPASADWTSGMMISMPVKQNDFAEFHQKAQQIFSWFRVPPKMVNSEQIRPREYSIETDDFAIPKAVTHAVCAVMGNVHYPIPSSEWGSHPWASTLIPVLRFKIGEVDVAASREQLEFTPKTRAAIDARMKLVKEHFGKKLNQQLTAFDLNMWSGIQAASEWLATSGVRWHSYMRDFLRGSGMDSKLVEQYVSLGNKYAHVPMPDDFKGKLTTKSINGRGQLRSEHHDFSGPVYMRRLPAYPSENSAILLLGNTRYIHDRVRAALHNGEYKTLIIIDGDDAAALEAAKLWYNFPTTKAEDLPLPTGWVRPSERPRKPKTPRALATAMGTMAIIDSAKGTYDEERQFLLAKATADQKYFVTPTVAWGKYTWHFGTQRFNDWHNAVEPIAQLAQFLPTAPRGIGLLLAGEVKRYRLEDKEGWKPLSAFKDTLLDQSVRDKVSALTNAQLSYVDASGHSYEHDSPARFLAAHSNANSVFWRTLVTLRPQSPLIAEAKRLGGGGSLTTSSHPIPVAVYNSALDVFGLGYQRIAPVQKTDSSMTLYPTFARVLSYYFPNGLVTENPALAARVVAQILEDDEQHLPSMFDLAA